MILTHETQVFLDRFRPPEDNNLTSCVFVLLMTIDLVVVVVDLSSRGAFTPPFIFKGVRL
jgi:hypothetical protein